MPAIAVLRVSLAGGANQTGGITATNSQTVDLSASTTAFWGSPAARWEIYSFPDGWSCPAGWFDAGDGTYYWLGNSSPPQFTLPAAGTWGKWLFRLTVNGGFTDGVADPTLKDESTAVSILSPSGLKDLAYKETTQFGGAARGWAKDHAANLRAFDALSLGTTAVLPWKTSVKAASTATLVISGSPQTIDGISCSTGDRVLVKNQAAPENNGIYVVAGGAWSRATDADGSSEVFAGMTVYVQEGTTQANQVYTLTTTGTITLGVTALTFASGPSYGGGASSYLSSKTAPALSGLVRASNNTTAVAARNFANTGDINVASTNASDAIVIGEDADAADIQLRNKTGSKVRLFCNGSEFLSAEPYGGTGTFFNTAYFGVVATSGGLIRTGSSLVIESASAQEQITLDTSSNISLFGTPSVGGGVKVLSIKNATTVPSSNPTAGGILYAEGGAGKWRGSSGTVTTFGPAEPHCPTCGRDFAHEWTNDATGEALAICAPCMLDEMGRAGLNVSAFAFIRSLNQ